MELFISNNNRFTLVLFKPISDHTVRWLAIISIQWRRISVLILICTKLLNSMDTQKMETKRSCQLKSFSLITCKLVSRKKLYTIKIYIKSRLHYIDINAYQRITRVSTNRRTGRKQNVYTYSVRAPFSSYLGAQMINQSII